MTVKLATTRGFFGYGCDALAGILSALVVAFSMAHLAPPAFLLVYFALVPLFVVGLSAGVRAGTLAALCGTMALFAAAPAIVGVFYFVAFALPSVGLIILALRQNVGSDGARQWFSANNLMIALAFYPCVVFLSVYALMMGQEGGLLAATAGALDGVVAQFGPLLEAQGEKLTPDMQRILQQYVHFIVPLVPALMICSWQVIVALMMGLAQFFSRQQGKALRPTFDLLCLRVPRWFVPLALIAAVGSFAPQPYGYVVTNLAIVCIMPFFFTGLAIIHERAARMHVPALALVLLYVLICVIVHVAVLVASLGAIDQLADFRKRFADKAAPSTVKQGELP